MLNLTKNCLLNCMAFVIVGGGFGCAQTIAQSAEDFPVPANMSVEGIPPIKKKEAEKLFVDPSEIKNNLIWDVDRKNRSILVTDERSYIYLVSSPLAKPEKLIDGRIPSTVRVSPNGNTFAFTDDKADADNFELYLWTEKDQLKKLSSFTGKDESVESFVWNKSGAKLLYSQSDYDSKVTKVCIHDLSASTCPITDLKGIWYVMDSDENNILLKYWKASSNQSLYLYDLATRKLSPLEEKGNSNKGFFAQDRVFWLSEGSDEYSERCLLSFDLKTRTRQRIALPAGVINLQDVKASPDGKSFLIQESKDGIDNLRIGKLKKNRIEDVVSPFVRGSFVIWGTRWLSNKEVAYTIENVGKPASVESFDYSSKKGTAWTKERIPAQFENAIRPPEVIQWKSFDGRLISGYMIKPRARVEKSPTVIYIHGGPQTIDRPIFDTSDILLATSLGITTIHTNIRGSKGFGIEYMDADNGPKRDDAVKDIRSLIDWIEKQPDLDSERIFVRGESYGGFIALAAALQEPQRVKAVIAEYPTVSIRGYLAQSFIDEFSINEFGDPKDESLMKKLDELSPLNNTNRWNKIPLFLTRGKLDARIPERDVLGLKNQLQESGTEVWFICANDAGHGVGGRYVTVAMYEFLKKRIGRN